MAPAQERLEAEDLAIPVRLRLVIEQEFILIEGAFEVLHQSSALAQTGAQGRIEKADAAAESLRAVERRISVGEDGLNRAVFGIEGDADADLGANLFSGDARRRPVRRAAARRDPTRAGRRPSRDDPGEFVSADASDLRVLGDCPEALRHTAQQFVPYKVAVDVVDLLEAIEVRK